MSATLPEVPLLERPDVDWERHKGDKRPKILPPPGETWRNPSTNRKVGHRYYTRVTTFADAITEGYNLTAWKLRRALLGLGQRADYVRLAASLTDSDRDRDALDELVGKALEAAGPNKADLGTALHSLTERLDRGEDIGTPPEEVLPDLAAYTALTEGQVVYRHREARVVCDELECAGTPDGHAIITEQPPTDRGVVCDCPPDVLRIIDTKTGSVRYPGKMSTQLAIYAHSDLYEPATGERKPVEVCPHWGVIVHLPVETGEAALFWIDLEHGWRGAQLCGPVRSWHRVKADDVLVPFATAKPVKVVDGEVTRIEPRLASVNLTAAPPAELGDVTEQLAASNAHAQQLAREAADAADRAERAAEGVAGLAAQRDDEGDEAALHEDIEPELDPVRQAFADAAGCDVRVVGTDDAGAPVHWCADHDSAWPHEPAPDPLDGRVAEAVHRALVGDEADRVLSVEPGPDACAHSGAVFIGPGGLTCRDCGEVLNATSPITRTPAAVEVDPVVTGQGSPMLDGGDPEPQDEPTDYPDESWASGPDSDAEDEPEPCGHRGPNGTTCIDPAGHTGSHGDGTVARWIVRDEPEPDPVAEAIRRCVTVRELELLGSTAWRSWTPAHRDLATEVHDRLKAAEDADAPRAATEAAITTAGTVEELTAVMLEVRDAPHMTPELFALADSRYWELKGRATS